MIGTAQLARPLRSWPLTLKGYHTSSSSRLAYSRQPTEVVEDLKLPTLRHLWESLFHAYHSNVLPSQDWKVAP